MFFDYYLKFQDEAEAMSILYRKEGVVEADPEQGIEGSEGYLSPNFDNIDIIGTIYEMPQDPEEEPVVLPGFHANVRNYTETDLLDSYLVHPQNPRRVWA